MLNEYTTETRSKESGAGEKRTKQSIRDTGSYQAGEREGWKRDIPRPREKPEADRGFRSSRKGKPWQSQSCTRGQELPGDS